MQPPILTITVPPSTRLKEFSEPISRLSAGDAHFSFIVTHFLEPVPGVEYYHSIWSIRTDSRSTNDAGWIPHRSWIENRFGSTRCYDNTPLQVQVPRNALR